MSDAREMAEWDRIAWIAFHIPKFSKKAPRHFEDYQPLRKGSRKTNAIAFLDALEKNRKRLPKEISNARLEKQFNAWVEKTGGVPDATWDEDDE
jgi:hypothetical protein